MRLPRDVNRPTVCKLDNCSVYAVLQYYAGLVCCPLRSHAGEGGVFCGQRKNSTAVWPHAEHILEVFFGSTAITIPFTQATSYSSWRRNSPHPASNMTRLRPDVWRTFLPGLYPRPERLRLNSKREKNTQF